MSLRLGPAVKAETPESTVFDRTFVDSYIHSLCGYAGPRALWFRHQLSQHLTLPKTLKCARDMTMRQRDP